jgi:hypothetical protein
MVFISLACNTQREAETAYDFAEFTARIWYDKQQELIGRNCDIDSEEAEDYRNCMFRWYLTAKAAGNVDIERVKSSCSSEYDKIPGCTSSFIPTSGVTTFVCDVSRQEEGTYNYEYCPIDGWVRLEILVNWETLEFTYDYEGVCQKVTGLICEYIKTQTESLYGGGRVNEAGWLSGTYQNTTTNSWEHPGAGALPAPRTCPNTSPPETQIISGSDTYIAGKLESTSHLIIGMSGYEAPLDLDALLGYAGWAELESSGLAVKSYDCYAE